MRRGGGHMKITVEGVTPATRNPATTLIFAA
jgi:hypothetical protein